MGLELKYQLDNQDINKFDDLFKEIEKIEEENDSIIDEFGISLSTL